MVEFGKSANRIMAGYFCQLVGVSGSLYPFLLLNFADSQFCASGGILKAE